MSIFPNWQQYAVPQRRAATGCIATSYEMMLRAAHAQGIDFTSFQDEFDLDKDLLPNESPRNNFNSVANAVHSKYPLVDFGISKFAPGAGTNKLQVIEDIILHQQPVLISITLTPRGVWHIVPVIDMDRDSLTVLWVMSPDGSMQREIIAKRELVRRHDNWPGGDDIAYLKSC